MGLTISYIQRTSGLVEIQDDPKLKNLTKYFNTTTLRGRSNLTKTILSVYLIAFIGFYWRAPGKKEDH